MPQEKNRFGNNLKMAKAIHNLNYTDFAKQLDTTESTITYYQNRGDNKFIDFLFLLKKAGVDINRLFTDSTI